MTTWIEDKVIYGKETGVLVDKVQHKVAPSIVKGAIEKGKCKHCQSQNGFVFVSESDKKVRVVFCLRCDKTSILKVEAERHRCIASNKDNQQCKNTAVLGSKYCNFHSYLEGGDNATKDKNEK